MGTSDNIEFITFREYRSNEEASYLIDILQKEGIEYIIEDIKPPVDITFAGAKYQYYKYAIKINPNDFEFVEGLITESEKIDLKDLPHDYYLFEFTDDELVEILDKFDEWSKTDYLIAQQILKDRGYDVSKEYTENLKTNRIETIREPEEGDIKWMLQAYVSTVLGGFLGIFIGNHLFRFKKKLPNGERVYAYNIKTRKHGLRILVISIIAFIFYITYFLILVVKSL